MIGCVWELVNHEYTFEIWNRGWFLHFLTSPFSNAPLPKGVFQNGVCRECNIENVEKFYILYFFYFVSNFGFTLKFAGDTFIYFRESVLVGSVCMIWKISKRVKRTLYDTSCRLSVDGANKNAAMVCAKLLRSCQTEHCRGNVIEITVLRRQLEANHS